jgi:hypothetical protein
MNDKNFSALCLKCDLREENRKKVSYSVLSMIIAVVGIFVGVSYSSLNNSLGGIKTDIVKFSQTIQECNIKSVHLETLQEVDERRFKEIEDHLRNVPQHPRYPGDSRFERKLTP